MKMKYSVLLALALCLISSCEKDFNINTGNAGNQAVVNSLFNDGSPITVFYTKPYPVGATNYYMTAIPDARIELYEDNVFKEVLHYVPSDTQALFGSYLSNLIPQQGKNYTVKTFEPNYANATATDQIPVPAQLITSSLEQYKDSTTHLAAKMYMVFRDNPNVQNYYRINVWIGGNLRNIDLGDTTYSFQFSAITPYSVIPLNDTVRDGDFLLFSDRGFNGQEKNLELTFNPVPRKEYSDLTLYVELHTVSYAHFEYFKTLNLYRSANSSNEPVYIYSNVNNGLGAFVAEHIQTLAFVIK
jgi:hypothetical protein